MYARRPATLRPATSRIKAWTAPVAGWIANRNLSLPNAMGTAQGGHVLENFYPKSNSIRLRRGKVLYAVLPEEELNVESLFTYSLGNNERLFAATKNEIRDISNLASKQNFILVDDLGNKIVTNLGDNIGRSPFQLEPEYADAGGGDWVTVQVTTPGGTYLIGVNGVSPGFVFDGSGMYRLVPGGNFAISYTGRVGKINRGDRITSTSGATGLVESVIYSEVNETSGGLVLSDITGTFVAGETATTETGSKVVLSSTATFLVGNITFAVGENETPLTTADMSFVWVYKSRVWFIQKDTLTAWYLPVGQVTGEASRYALNGNFHLGGSLLIGQSWSLDSGASGGLSDQCVFITDEGEVSVWQGSNPESASDFFNAGLYRIGPPLGKKAFIRAGGDLVVSTTVGFISLAKASSKDYAALSSDAVSYPIEEAWNQALITYGQTGWNAILWAEKQMTCVAPPRPDNNAAEEMYICNASTGAWSRYTGWSAYSFAVFKGRLYFGSSSAMVYEADVSGSDDGKVYTGRYMPLFDDIGDPSTLKIAEIARVSIISSIEVEPQISAAYDYDVKFNPPPESAEISSDSYWGTGIWGEFIWGSGNAAPTNWLKWQSVGGTGYAMSLAVQISSGSVAPIDAEIVRSEMTYQTAAMVS